MRKEGADGSFGGANPGTFSIPNNSPAVHLCDGRSAGSAIDTTHLYFPAGDASIALVRTLPPRRQPRGEEMSARVDLRTIRVSGLCPACGCRLHPIRRDG